MLCDIDVSRFLFFPQVSVYIFTFRCVRVCVCVPHACSVCGCWKRALELESQAVVNHHVGARNRTGVLSKSSKYS